MKLIIERPLTTSQEKRKKTSLGIGCQRSIINFYLFITSFHLSLELAFEKRSQLIIEDLSGKKHFRYAFSTEDKSSQ